MAFSPDGKKIVSGGYDKTLRVWDAFSGQEALTLKGHTGGVTSVAFSPDGKSVLSGSSDRTLKVWDASSGQDTLTLKGHTDAANSAAFSPDGKKIVSASQDKTLKVWDASIRQEVRTIRGDSYTVSSVAISPDGTKIVSGEAKTLHVWDASSGQEILTFKGHTSFVSSVAFSSDGRKIVSASDDKTVKVWDVFSGHENLALKGHTASVIAVAISPDGKRIASGSADKTLKVWDVSSGQETLALKGHTSPVFSVAFSADGKKIVSGSDDRMLKVWDASSGQEILTLKGHGQVVQSVAFSPDGEKIVSGSGDRTLKVWDVSSGQEILTLKGHTNNVAGVTFSPDGKKIVSASYDKTLKVWDVSSGQDTLTLTGHAGGVTGVVFSPDGKTIVSGSGDKTLKVWRLQGGEEPRGEPVGGDSPKPKDSPPDKQPSLTTVAEPDNIPFLERQLAIFLDSGEAPKSVDNQVKLAQYCRGTKQYHAAAARLYAGVVAAGPSSMPFNKQLIRQQKSTLEKSDPANPKVKGAYQKIISINLTGNKTYIIELKKTPGSSLNPYLRLEDASGKVLAEDEDGGFPNARITLKFPQRGIYRVVATSSAPGKTGEFLLLIWETKMIVRDLAKLFRYQAACSAALAAANRGLDPQKLGEQDKAKFRAQALDWLGADLESYTAQTRTGPAEATLRVIDKLTKWREVADLSSIREPEALAVLPAQEQSSWRKLWGDADQVLTQAKAGFTTQFTFQGTLTNRDQEQIHHVKLFAGTTYFIDLHSAVFDTYLKLLDNNGNLVAWNDDIASDNVNSRLSFKPAVEGAFRIVATSFQNRASGAYTVTVRTSKNESELGSDSPKSKVPPPDKQPPPPVVTKPDNRTPVERQLAAFLDKGEVPAGVVDQLKLADYCRRTKQYHAAAAKLYAGIFAAGPSSKPVIGTKVVYQQQGTLQANDSANPKRQGAYQKVFNVKLSADTTYIIDLKKTPGSSLDPYLRLEDNSGKVLTEDDDGGGFPNARIALRIPQNGTYRVVVTSYAPGETGGFLLVISQTGEIDLARAFRYQAACSAGLATAGKGLDPQKPGEQDNAKLRAQALDWLRADLALYAIQSRTEMTEERLLVIDKITHWREVADLASVREPKALAALPAPEQSSWAKLWSDANQLLKQAEAGFTTQSTMQGTLTDQKREQVHDVKLLAGTTYFIDMHSGVFDTYLKLLDNKGNLLAENDDIASDNLNSRLIFTPKEEDAVRIVATSFQNMGMGAYTVTVRTMRSKNELDQKMR